MLANADGTEDGSILPPHNAWSGETFVAFDRGEAQPDIVAHEMNHVLVHRLRQNPDTSWVRLGGEKDAGAFNEGLADFFGEGFERYATGTHNWILGTEGFRDMANPTSTLDPSRGVPNPDRYLSPNFNTGPDTGANDWGGIHTNSTVFTHGAYLASDGGTFNGYTITGIGFDKVEQILYRAETQYFVSDETFNQAYADIVQAATDLYSAADVAQVEAAFQAVQMNLIRPTPGDFNDDGHVDARDIAFMESALANPAGYEQGRGFIDDQMRILGDLNGDGSITNADLQRLLNLLIAGGGSSNPVPEPASAILILAALPAIFGFRRRS